MTASNEKTPLVDDAGGEVPGELVVLEPDLIRCCGRQSVAPNAEKAIMNLGVVIMVEILIVLSAYTGGVLARLVDQLFG